VTGSQLLVEARRRAGITQAELARRVGTTQSAIARIERGHSESSFSRLQEMIRACGFALRVRLVPDDLDFSMIERNLELTPTERVQRVSRLHNFVAAGRAANRG
jgi:transcriptional regulator with XRE-family HTH domain